MHGLYCLTCITKLQTRKKCSKLWLAALPCGRTCELHLHCLRVRHHLLCMQDALRIEVLGPARMVANIIPGGSRRCSTSSFTGS
jgi:hypothetical protein